MGPDARFLNQFGLHLRLRGELGVYAIVQQLGSGGNGTAFLCYGHSGPFAGSLLAVKVFHGSDLARRRRFEVEVETGKKMDHRSVVKVIDSGAYLDRPFAVMEYWPETLSGAMAKNSLGTLSKLTFALQLLSALSYIAEKKAVHRDVKPENIFVRGSACALGDLGLMLLDGDSDVDDLEHTLIASQPGEARMPRCYRSPELVSAIKIGQRVTPASDVYQLGLVLSELFLGENPQEPPAKGDDGRFDLRCEIRMKELPKSVNNLHTRVRQLISGMLASDESSRPSAPQLLDDWLGVFVEACNKSLEVDPKIVMRW